MAGRILRGPPESFEIPDKTVGQFFFEQSQKFSEQISQIDGENDVQETFDSVNKRSIRVAIEMRKRGVTSEDVILNCCTPILDSTIPVVATFYLGAKIANLDTNLAVATTRPLLTVLSPKMIFVQDCALRLIEDSLKNTDLEPEVIVVGHSETYATLADLLKVCDEEETFRPAGGSITDTAFMLFSSGTTGTPKAICLSNKMLLSMGLEITKMPMSPIPPVTLAFSSLHWFSAMASLTIGFAIGGVRLLVTSFEAEKAFRLIDKYRVGVLIVAPIAAYSLTSYKQSANFDTSSLRMVHLSGSTVSPHQLQKLRDLFMSAAVIYGYGSSEVGGVSVLNPLSQKNWMTKVGSSGKLVRGVQLKIVDEQTRELLGPNQKGEICAKSSVMLKEYYKVDSSPYFDEDGFYKTGDVGYYDEDEFLYVVERIKEIFKYQGWQIVPSLLEGVLQEHPAVKEAVVFGVPHELDGDRPAAAVVLVEGSTATADEIKEFLAKKVLDREKLRGGLAIVKSLPKTPSEKIMRRRVNELVANDLV